MITQIFPVDFFVKVRPPNFQEILATVSPFEMETSSPQEGNWGNNCSVKTIYLDTNKWKSSL